MSNCTPLAQQILHFYDTLGKKLPILPTGFKFVNPLKGDQKEQVSKIMTAFYNKYYNDTRLRRLIFGSSPARRGSAVVGVPFEDAKHLQNETGIFINNFYINKSSFGFLYDVIERYGGCKKFYADFYMNFVCPIGIVKTNPNGNEVNCNYYESKPLQEAVYPFIIDVIRSQVSFGFDTSVCYCIGSGENYDFLLRINKEYNFFGTIIPLEHPRFIMQYNSRNKDKFIEKYISALQLPKSNSK